ncbi:hypothetical protein TrLO_g6134 [Triparma laevis f. longispina]|uniref:phosphoribosylaminoimidazole carboxylase n=1 Tax=Triparma laevis f. longispina TaxID=1714387 RepID=A0A9W7A5L9_9STRA|nr:hypothetical protein TrLO_g6134 [Triparma laevis f. longispina]
MLAFRATVSRFTSQALVCSGARNRFIHVGARKNFDLRVRRFSEGNGGGIDEEVGIPKNEGLGIRLNEAALSDFLGVVCEGGGVANPLEGVAELDHARRERTNFPEVVFGENKTASQISSILSSLLTNSTSTLPVLATRVSPKVYSEVAALYSGPGTLTYHDLSRIIKLDPDSPPPPIPSTRKSVIIATAGTTDIPIAEEALLTLSSSSVNTIPVYDCGVAGLHRILKKLPILTSPDVGCIIVCAGMDGALPSVISGLVKCPVIAVPTSIGYGASFGGVSAMGTMLNSCSPGVSVVNIDNGFGAACVAYKIVTGNES